MQQTRSSILYGTLGEEYDLQCHQGRQINYNYHELKISVERIFTGVIQVKFY